MISVLLDSSNTALSVGIASENKLIDFVSYEAWQQQSEFIIPELNKLLEKNNYAKNDIEDVIVAIGPGSYTGVRISITIAKVMATALKIPVFTISSLHAQKDCKNPSICLINARSNRSYIGVYENEQTIMNDCIMTNDEVRNYISLHPDYSICGNTSYLGIDGVRSNILEQMISIKSNLTKCPDVLGLKPVYMKD